MAQILNQIKDLFTDNNHISKDGSVSDRNNYSKFVDDIDKENPSDFDINTLIFDYKSNRNYIVKSHDNSKIFVPVSIDLDI